MNLPLPTISVIIPIYNVEKYLLNCLESVAAQTFPDFEALLIIDGATDQSAIIAEEFAQTDQRFRTIYQENKGLSGARNTALRLMCGKYVFYLDSDDYLVPEALQTLYGAAIKNNADVVQGNFYYDYPDYLLLNKQQKKKEMIYTRHEAMWALLEHRTVLNFAWGKLVKTDLAKKYPFPEGKYFEDTLWMAQIINGCETYVALKEPILYYLQRGTSISGGFSLRNLDQLEGEADRLNFLKQFYPPDFYKKALELLHHKIIQHKALLSALDPFDRKVYEDKLADLEKRFKFQLAHMILRNTKRIATKIKHRIFAASHWKKIIKSDINK